MPGRLWDRIRSYHWILYFLVIPIAFVAASARENQRRNEALHRDVKLLLEKEGYSMDSVTKCWQYPFETDFWQEFVLVSALGFVLLGLITILGDSGNGKWPFSPRNSRPQG